MVTLKKHMSALSLACVYVLAPASAQAVQPHRGLESLVSHELGHLLFIAGLVFMLFHARLASAEFTGTGWRRFKQFLYLALAWNVLTFSSHWLDLYLAEQVVSPSAGYRVESLLDLFYYVSKLDHLLLLPALLCLLTALTNWAKTQEKR